MIFGETFAEKEKRLAEQEVWIKRWASLRSILEFHWTEEFGSGDLLIRVVRSKAKNHTSPYVTPEMCEVKPTGKG